MSDTEQKLTPEQQYDAQVAALGAAAQTSIDPCLVAKFIAARDTAVREKFYKTISEGYEFKRIYCTDKPIVLEHILVVFEFGCIPGTICLKPPTFAAIVDLIRGVVVGIIDYPPPTLPNAGQAKCGCSGGGAAHGSPQKSIADCANIVVDDGKVCLDVDYVGRLVCISVPNWIPDGTIAEACIHICKKLGVPCGAEVVVKVAGEEVASQSWGCC